LPVFAEFTGVAVNETRHETFTEKNQVDDTSLPRDDYGLLAGGNAAVLKI